MRDVRRPKISRKRASAVTDNLLPSASKDLYDLAYKNFVCLKGQNGADGFSETVLLTYSGEFSQNYKSSTHIMVNLFHAEKITSS